MKKALALLFAVIMVFSLTACGKKEKNEDFGGTYKVDHMEYNDSDYSLEQLKSLGKDFSNVYLILNSSGKAYLCIDDDFQEANWSKSDDYIMFGSEKHSIVDGMICLGNDDYKLYFKKDSNSQIIPNKNSETASNAEQSNDNTYTSSTESEATTNIESSKSSESTSNSTDDNLVDGMHKDFKESMDSYEKFMDEYVEFMKKYKSNPTDLGLLGDYATFMSKYTDMVSKFDKWESEDLNDTELAYYLDVQTRVTKKLLEVAN